jgi:hypothetical protein
VCGAPPSQEPQFPHLRSGMRVGSRPAPRAFLSQEKLGNCQAHPGGPADSYSLPSGL